MSYMLSEIKCPFFVSETEKCICCEGIETDSKNTMRFIDAKSKIKYIGKHCVNFPNECCIFKGAWESRIKK